MDEFIFAVHQNVSYILILAILLIAAKFVAGLLFFRGNVVDSFIKFFSFYSASNIDMTDTTSHKLYKHANNLFNVVIYLLVIVFTIFYYIYPSFVE